MFCKNCGKKINDNEKICQECRPINKSEYKNEVKYASQTWYQGSRNKAVIFLSLIFLLALWYRFILAIILLPMIYFVKKGKRSAMILAGIYSGILTFINVAVYIENNRDGQGLFYASLMPVYIYFGMYILSIIFIVKSYKVGRIKK